MPNESNTIPPLDKATLEKLGELSETRSGLCEQAVDLELERIRVLADIKRVSSEQEALYAAILHDRGLPENTRISISRSGEVTLLGS